MFFYFFYFIKGYSGKYYFICHSIDLQGDDGLAVISGGRIQGIVGNTPETVADCGKGYPEIYARVSSFSSWISSERARN